MPASFARQALRVIALTCLAAGLAMTVGAQESGRSAPAAHVAPLVGPIGPATAAFITRAIEQAEAADAEALILEMDTPGGLDAAMRDINQAILGAELPVITYVHPPGGRAASAGAFILYASHVAAMAPGTTVGAATPVQMGGAPGQEPPPDPAEPAASGDPADAEAGDGAASAPSNQQALRNKAVNDAVAYIRSLAELRGRNADWAEAAVRDAASVSAEEALALNVIEFRAESLADLLAQADGMTVSLESGGTAVLALEDAQIVRLEKTFAEEALAVITNPNIAFLLMNLGFLGLVVSLYNGLEPITAIAGLICLIIGLYALNTLPVNYAGAALIVLGLALLVAEAFVASAGLLALGGLIAFAIGALMLVDTEQEAFRIDWRLIAGVTAALGGATFLLVGYGLAAQTRKVSTGAKGLVGQTGRVLEWSGGEGFVLIEGERWRAVSTAALQEGDRGKVVTVEGLTLKVKPVK